MRNPFDYFRSTPTETAEDTPETENQPETIEDTGESEENGLSRYMEAHRTTREYTEPILLEKPEIRKSSPFTSIIASAIESAQVQPINIEFPTMGTNETHIDLTLSSELEKEGGYIHRNVKLTLTISEFTKWAAESRLEEVENEMGVDSMLGMNGPYYVKLQGELEEIVREAIGRQTLFFEVEQYNEETDTAIVSETISLSAYDKQWE